MAERLLEVRNLRTIFPTEDGDVKAVDGVSFHLDAGETLGIVGESGSGKSVTALSIMRLIQSPGRIAGGEILFRGRDLTTLSQSEMEEIRGEEMAMIFQDPMTSMNPVFKTGWQVREPLQLHRNMGRRAALAEAVKMLGRVGIPDPNQRAGMYPHEFSGGMRQRAMIAMALTTGPPLLIADEPTTALDVTIQAQILELLKEINAKFGTATILITHNLGVVAGMCERVLVMYAGRIVEEGTADEVFTRPRHPYTWSLLKSMPRLNATEETELSTIAGQPPDLSDLPSGCAFHPRCPFAMDTCVHEAPALTGFGGLHRAACWMTAAGGDMDAAAKTDSSA